MSEASLPPLRAVPDETLGLQAGRPALETAPATFRRFCATMRRVYGWSVPEIAEYLDDTEGVISNNYIDQMFVRRVGIRHKRKDGERPTLPPLWNVPKDLDLDPICLPRVPRGEARRRDWTRKASQ